MKPILLAVLAALALAACSTTTTCEDLGSRKSCQTVGWPWPHTPR